MLAIMAKSGADHLLKSSAETKQPPPPHQPKGNPAAAEEVGERLARLTTLTQSAAAAQVILAVLAVTVYHVQIITRISSGYPLWYWWLARRLLGKDVWGKRIVVFMVMYSSIQGALFSSFLPPA